MRYLVAISLCCAVAWGGLSVSAAQAQEKAFLTEAEGSACMGDDKSRKQTEEVAREEAKRRAAEQSATQIRSQSRVSVGTLEEDVIKIMATGKVRILAVLESKWDKDGCYLYRIRAEVTQPKPSEMLGVVMTEEDRLWEKLEDTPDLRSVDLFLSRFPFSVHNAKVRALQIELEPAFPRTAGPYLVYRETPLHLRPASGSISINEASAGEIVRVIKMHNSEWAVIKRDVGQVFTPFSNLRPITDDEASAWERSLKAGKDARTWQTFLQTFPNSHLARLASERLSNTQNRLAQDDSLSKRDSEEIALWNRCLNTRDIQCAREYRRRYPNGKFERESWQIR